MIQWFENRQPIGFIPIGGQIWVKTMLFPYGYPSYPKMCDNLTFDHKIVNHSLRFVAPDGTHTNN